MMSHHLLEPIGAGGSAEVFRLDGGRVLKLYREGLDPGVIEREQDGVRHAEEQGLYVARAVETTALGERQGVIFEEIDGTPLLARASRRFWRLTGLLHRFADYHAEIHRCSGEGLIHAQHIIVEVRLLHAETSEALRDAAIAQLRTLPISDRLCHGDFHPANAMMTTRGIAAIDWSNGSVGDPAGDVARTEMLIRYADYGPLLRRFPMLRFVRHRAANIYLKHYRAITGMTEAAIDAWRVPLAVAALVPGSRVDRDAISEWLAQRGHSA
jgi:thiamine kinase